MTDILHLTPEMEVRPEPSVAERAGYALYIKVHGYSSAAEVPEWIVQVWVRDAAVRHHYADMARAVMEVLREPTEKMLMRGYETLYPEADAIPSKTWHAMLDEARK